MKVRDMLVGATLGAILVGGASSLAQVPTQPVPIDNDLPQTAPAPVVAPAAAPEPAAADPMQEVDAFVAHSREQAEAKIKALTEEAETLRARLARVDAANARGQAVARALDAPAANVEGADAPKPAGDVLPGEPVLSPAAAPEPR